MSKQTDLEPGTLSRIVRCDSEIPIVYKAIERTVFASFAEDAKNSLIIIPGRNLNPSQQAVKERLNICLNWLLLARNELQFSLDRALAKMPYYLRCTLDGIPFNPEDWANRGYFVE